jgi:hypothetical protein
MNDPILVACLVRLRWEFDRIAPDRPHTSDGWIGNKAHELEVSDHNPDETGKVPIHDADHINEVHAIDVTNVMNESDLTMEKCVQFLLARCRSGKEKRLRYIIYNRRIWSASSGWIQKKYTGASPHTEHAHFSCSYESAKEADTSSWHLEEIPVALTESDKSAIKTMIHDEIRGAFAEYVKQWLAATYGNTVYPTRTLQQHTNDMQTLRDLFADPDAAKKITLKTGSGLSRILQAADLIIANSNKAT